MVKNYIQYVNKPMNSEGVKNLEIEQLESEVNASISVFAKLRNCYLKDLKRLRQTYGPLFDDLIESIKSNKSKLEDLTDSEVILDE